MQSPPAEWILGISYLAILDWLRSRGEADGDTLSEVTRDVVARHPRGEQIFTGVLLLGGYALHRHIVNPLRRPRP